MRKKYNTNRLAVFAVLFLVLAASLYKGFRLGNSRQNVSALIDRLNEKMKIEAVQSQKKQSAVVKMSQYGISEEQAVKIIDGISYSQVYEAAKYIAEGGWTSTDDLADHLAAELGLQNINMQIVKADLKKRVNPKVLRGEAAQMTTNDAAMLFMFPIIKGTLIQAVLQ